MARSFLSFIPNPQLGRLFQTRARRAIEQASSALERWAQTWSPGGAGVTGAAVGSYFVVPIRNGDRFTVILARHMQYGRWQEFGAISVGEGEMSAPTLGSLDEATDVQRPNVAMSADDLIRRIRDEVRQVVQQAFRRAWQ